MNITLDPPGVSAPDVTYQTSGDEMSQAIREIVQRNIARDQYENDLRSRVRREIENWSLDNLTWHE